MAKRILFQWTGFAPRSMYAQRAPYKTHIVQAACAAVFPSKAAFMRATGRTAASLQYVGIHELDEGYDPVNPGARLAIENPGVVFWKDDLRHPRNEAPWLVHDAPEFS